MSGQPVVLQRASVRQLLRTTGPRLLLSGLGPVAAFYAGYRISGLLLGVVLATAAGLSLYAYEHVHGRPGFLARFVLVIVFVQAAVGLLSRNATLYFFQPVVVDTLIAILFAGSLAIRRPIIGEFARETYPFPQEVRESQTYRSVFGRITLVWSTYFFLRALVRLAGLASGQVEVILIVLAVSDAPFIVALTLWSIWQGTRGFRASAEWGPALATLEAEPAA